MALSQVQSNTGTGNTNSSTQSATFSSPVGSGNLVVVVIGCNTSQSVSSVTDDKSNSYSLATSSKDTSTGNRTVEVWYCKSATGGPTIVTATFNVSAANRRSLYISEVSGADATTPFDASGTKSDAGGGSNLTGASVTTVAANTYIITGVRTQGTLNSVSSPFTLNTADSAGGAAFQIVAAQGSYAPTWGFISTAPTDDAYTSVSFAQAGGGATTAPKAQASASGVTWTWKI